MKQFDLLMAYDAYQLSNWIDEAMFDSTLLRDEEDKLKDIVESQFADIHKMDLTEFAHYVCELAKSDAVVSHPDQHVDYRRVNSLYMVLTSIDELKVIDYLKSEAFQDDVDELVTSKLLTLLNDDSLSVTEELAKVANMSKDDFAKVLLFMACGRTIGGHKNDI